MRKRDEIQTYLQGLKTAQNAIPTEVRSTHPQVIAVHVALHTLKTTSSPQAFVAELQGKRNMANHHDLEKLSELKREYNAILDFANSEPGDDHSTWETNEVRLHLINEPDESLIPRLAGMSVEMLKEWVYMQNAPQALYDSLQREHGSLANVDWAHIKECLEDLS